MIKTNKINVLILLFILISSFTLSLEARSKTVINVAVAANFIPPMQVIAATYEKSCDCKLSLSFASSAKLFAQINHGAPFDIFLSADTEKPAVLVELKSAVASPYTYAKGQLVLWSAQPEVNVQQQLLSGKFDTLAIANPELAPYGRAATEALKALGVFERDRQKLVRGENIAQAYQFVHSHNANLGFVALSQISGHSYGASSISNAEKTNIWLVPQALYRPINQSAVLLTRAQDKPAAKAFFAYLQSPEVRRAIAKFGYR